MAGLNLKGYNFKETEVAEVARIVEAVFEGNSAIKALRSLSAGGTGLKLLATRTGENGGRGITAAGFHSSGLLKHYLPYGAKTLRYAFTGITIDSSGEFPSPPTALCLQGATPAAGGAGYVLGEIITLAAGGTGQTPAQVRVAAINAGAVTRVIVVEPGCWDSAPADPVAQAATSGAGAGATFNVQLQGTANLINIALQPDSEVQNVTQRVYFDVGPAGSARSYSNVPSGGVSISSSLSVDLPPGQRIATRSFTQGGSLPVGRRIRGGERFGFSATSVDDSGASSVTTIPDGSYGNSYQPLAIFGLPQTPGDSCVIISDSIEHGTVGAGNLPDTMDVSGNSGWMERMINNRMPFVNLSVPGIAPSELFANPSLYVMLIGQLYKLRAAGVVFDTAFDGLFVNDANAAPTYAQIIAYKRTLWRELRALGFRKIVCRTAFPLTSGSFADLGGQTIVTGNNANVKLSTWNADLTAGAFNSEIDDYYDVRPLTESVSQPGKWNPGLTNDGVHPNEACSILLAANLNMRKLLTD